MLEHVNNSSDIVSFKVPKITLISKYCILTMEPAILINFGTLSKPTYNTIV